MKNIAIFASTKASDLPAIIKSIDSWILKWKCKVVAWVVNDKNSWAIEKLDGYEIPYFLATTMWPDRKAIYDTIDNYLWWMNIDLIVCVWWMHIMEKNFTRKWDRKILNVHPSLLPKYPWMHAIKDVLRKKEKLTWCTVHYVDEWIDTWDIIMQKEVEVSDDDGFKSLKQKIQLAEQEIYPKAILEVLDSI